MKKIKINGLTKNVGCMKLILIDKNTIILKKIK